MIRELTIGNQTYPTNLIQGPLAGISCAPFRRPIWQHSQPAFVYTEMISCKTILHQPTAALNRFIKIDPTEGPACFQLSSSNSAELAEATKRVTDYGARLIDLNCGCPVKKIRSRGAGSSLLMEPTKLYQLITAMKNNTHLPVSIKIRVEGGSGDMFNAEVARVVAEAGADFLVVHGRHWTEHYETPCDYNEIQFFVEQLTIPVIGNGDTRCIASLKKMFATGCAGVMIARAGVGQPWLIAQLTAEMRGETFALPASTQIGHLFVEHVTELIELLGSEKFAIFQARKFAKYYGRQLTHRAEFCEKINKCSELIHLKEICVDYFNC